jgi:HAD superfamily hydrolase (TIGR01509 family)
MIRAVLFDIDGVLVDSFVANNDFFSRLFTAAGHPPLPISEHKTMLHMSVAGIIQKHTGCDAQELDRVGLLAKTTSRSTHLYEFPKQHRAVLQALSQEYKLGIVTSRAAEGVDAYFAAANTRSLFSSVVYFGQYARAKPDPEPLLLGLGQLQVAPHDAVYVGDTAADIEAAKAAGMKVIQFAAYATPVPGADATTAVFAELPSIIKRIA